MSTFQKVTMHALCITVLSAPLYVFAQNGPTETFGPIGTAIENTLKFFNRIIVPAIFAAAFVFFLWGMFKYFFLSGGSEEGRSQGKQLAIWSVIAFVIMVSLWGLVNVVATGLGFYSGQGSTLPTLPRVPEGSGGSSGGGSGAGGSGAGQFAVPAAGAQPGDPGTAF